MSWECMPIALKMERKQGGRGQTATVAVGVCDKGTRRNLISDFPFMAAHRPSASFSSLYTSMANTLTTNSCESDLQLQATAVSIISAFCR